LCLRGSTEDFSSFVSLACHDLRTPLATVNGFAHTLEQAGDLGDPAARYVSMMRAAAEQMAELLDALGVVARIEADRYEPPMIETDSLELAQAAAERLGEKAEAGGSGATVRVDRVPVEVGLARSRCARVATGASSGPARRAPARRSRSPGPEAVGRSCSRRT
jgi:signal transduction histidine kinase